MVGNWWPFFDVILRSNWCHSSMSFFDAIGVILRCHSSMQLVAIVRCNWWPFFDASRHLVKAIYKVERGGYPTAFVLSKNKGLAAVYPPRFYLVSFFIRITVIPPLVLWQPPPPVLDGYPKPWLGVLTKEGCPLIRRRAGA